MSKMMIATFVALATLATGCFVELDDPSVALTTVCAGMLDCTIAGVPAQAQARTEATLALANGSHDFAIDLGDKPIAASTQTYGPATLASKLALDELVIEAHDGVALDGITHLDITEVAAVDCTGDAACAPQLIATFDRQIGAGATASDPTKLTMIGSGFNLLDLGTKFSVRLSAAGRVPTRDWSADLVFVAHLDEQAR